MRRPNYLETGAETHTFLLARVPGSHDNWPAQVDLVRSRIAELAGELGEMDSLLERPYPPDGGACRKAVEFLTSSERVWLRWRDRDRLRGYSERLINGHLADLKSVAPTLTALPVTLGAASAIAEAVERGHTVVLEPRDKGQQPVVIRRAVLDVRRGVLSVGELPGTDAPLRELNLYQFFAAEVLDG